MERKTIGNLADTTQEITEELIAFIAKEKPLVGKILGDEDLTGYLQKMSQERYEYRMSVLEKSYNKIPENRLDKPLCLFLQVYGTEIMRYPITRLSALLKKVKKVSGIKNIFSQVAQTSLTRDVVRIQELLSLKLIEFLNEYFTPVFTDPRYADSLDVLYQRAEGFTLRNIAEKRNLTRERIRQIELKSSEKLAALIKDFPFNIPAFICADTDGNDYISAGSIREYLDNFQYSSHLVYLLENENIYKEYLYNKQYDVFYRSGIELDFSTLDIKNPSKNRY